MKRPTHRGRKDIDEKISFLQQYKLEKGCSKCGYKETAQALEFDHVDRNKKRFKMSKAYRHSWPDILEEMEKCVILCANCHREKTVEEKDYLNIEREPKEEVRQYDLFGY